MSMTVTKGEGVTVFTVTSNPKSQCPLLCQILGNLCYSPVYSVSQRLKRMLQGSHSTLGTLQIIVGLLSIGFGAVFVSIPIYNWLNDTHAPFWLGGVFIAAGIMCILAERFPSPCLVGLTVIMNVVSAGLAVTAIVMYSVDLGQGHALYWDCRQYGEDREYRYSTISPQQQIIIKDNEEICKDFKHIIMVVLGGLEIMMIVFAVLQLCVTISASVLGLKALCNNQRDEKPMQDPELHQRLLEEVTCNPAA